jgi:para-nitrobenzyl esterase
MWDHGYPAMDDPGYHAFHASELPYVFGTFDTLPPIWPKIPDTAVEHAMSDALIDYWTSFAKTGKPTAANQPDWPRFDGNQAYMHFAATPQPQTEVHPGMYPLYEEVMCRRRAAGNLAWNWNAGLAAPVLPPKVPGCE